MTNPTANPTTTDRLQHCAFCGGKVAPYGPSEVSDEERFVHGAEVSSYACATCGKDRPAPFLDATGEECPSCKGLTPYSCAHCPRCGAKQRWAKAS